MIDINFKYVLIAFLILIISSCAIVLLTISSNDEASSIKLVTSIPQDSKTSSGTAESQTNKTRTKETKKAASTDKEKRTIKKSTVTSSPAKTTSFVTSVSFPLDINKATKDELMQIDGIGEVTANKILSHRKKLKYYSNLLQLKEIDGIGEATYLNLKKYLYVSKDKYKKMSETSKTVTTKITSNSKTRATKHTYKAQLTTEKQMKMVNINTADKQELLDSLLINEDLASEIINFREKIGGQYANTLELLMIMEDREYNRIKDYITI